MRWIYCWLVALIFMGGCAGRKSSLLLERNARGLLSDAPSVGRIVDWQVEPRYQKLAKEGIEVSVTYGSKDFQKGFFSNKKMFGTYAGSTPYFPEQLVFYVTITNNSKEMIYIDPARFVLVDNRGNQYKPLGIDYITAFANSRAPVSSTARSVLENARPGYFGFSLPVGRWIAQKPQGPFALLKQSALLAGFLYPGVAYDGLVTFWSPAEGVTGIRLLLTEIKTQFDANDIPTLAIEFPFDFRISEQSVKKD